MCFLDLADYLGLKEEVIAQVNEVFSFDPLANEAAQQNEKPLKKCNTQAENMQNVNSLQDLQRQPNPGSTTDLSGPAAGLNLTNRNKSEAKFKDYAKRHAQK